MATGLTTVPFEAAPAAGGAALWTASVAGAAAAAGLLAGWAPLGFSVGIVFLFAGPHNWMEARYFLSRMPSRWGSRRPYFLLGAAGVIVLSLGSLALPLAARRGAWSGADWLTALALWNSALALWLLGLVRLRARETRRDHWGWTAVAAWLLVAAAWLWPLAWSLALVFLHPLLALAFLDRELGRRSRRRQAAYRWGLLAVPAALALMVGQLHDAPDLAGGDLLSMRVTQQAGGAVLPHVSSHLLVAAHAYLEMLHYLVWLAAVPLLNWPQTPGQWRRIPLARKSPRWRVAIASGLLIGLAAVVALWAGFAINYPLTRDIYFAVAIFHVLAEAPFFVRML